MALETISSYPEDGIHAYTDGSAVRAIRNGGYGSVINAPDFEEPILLSGPCGAYCINYDAELVAIHCCYKDIVLFSDSQSVIQAVENWQDGEAKGIENIIQTSDKILRLYGKEITIQWIPGHSDIRMNDRADKLAKTGSHMQQENIPTS